MTRQLAIVRLTPFELGALQNLFVDYLSREFRALDFVGPGGVVHTPEQLGEIFAKLQVRDVPANTFTSVELEGMLEKLQAEERRRVEFERGNTHGAVVVLDGGAIGPERPIAGLDLSPPCHRGAPVQARYTAQGVVELRCALPECQQKLANVLVA